MYLQKNFDIRFFTYTKIFRYILILISTIESFRYSCIIPAILNILHVFSSLSSNICSLIAHSILFTRNALISSVLSNKKLLVIGSLSKYFSKRPLIPSLPPTKVMVILYGLPSAFAISSTTLFTFNKISASRFSQSTHFSKEELLSLKLINSEYSKIREVKLFSSRFL